MLKIGLIVGFGFMLLGPAAIAQEPGTVPACIGDIRKLCAGVKPGEGRIRDCAKQHFNQLPVSCQKIVLKVAAVGQACSSDVKKFCAGVQPGEGRIEDCMESHMGEMNEQCIAALLEALPGD
jgi:hypothetical protein